MATTLTADEPCRKKALAAHRELSICLLSLPLLAQNQLLSELGAEDLASLRLVSWPYRCLVDSCLSRLSPWLLTGCRTDAAGPSSSASSSSATGLADFPPEAVQSLVLSHHPFLDRSHDATGGPFDDRRKGHLGSQLLLHMPRRLQPGGLAGGLASLPDLRSLRVNMLCAIDFAAARTAAREDLSSPAAKEQARRFLSTPIPFVQHILFAANAGAAGEQQQGGAAGGAVLGPGPGLGPGQVQGQGQGQVQGPGGAGEGGPGPVQQQPWQQGAAAAPEPAPGGVQGPGAGQPGQGGGAAGEEPAAGAAGAWPAAERGHSVATQVEGQAGAGGQAAGGPQTEAGEPSGEPGAGGGGDTGIAATSVAAPAGAGGAGPGAVQAVPGAGAGVGVEPQAAAAGAAPAQRRRNSPPWLTDFNRLRLYNFRTHQLTRFREARVSQQLCAAMRLLPLHAPRLRSLLASEVPYVRETFAALAQCTALTHLSLLPRTAGAGHGLGLPRADTWRNAMVEGLGNAAVGQGIGDVAGQGDPAGVAAGGAAGGAAAAGGGNGAGAAAGAGAEPASAGGGGAAGIAAAAAAAAAPAPGGEAAPGQHGGDRATAPATAPGELLHSHLWLLVCGLPLLCRLELVASPFAPDVDFAVLSRLTALSYLQLNQGGWYDSQVGGRHERLPEDYSAVPLVHEWRGLGALATLPHLHTLALTGVSGCGCICWCVLEGGLVGPGGLHTVALTGVYGRGYVRGCVCVGGRAGPGGRPCRTCAPWPSQVCEWADGRVL